MRNMTLKSFLNGQNRRNKWKLKMPKYSAEIAWEVVFFGIQRQNSYFFEDKHLTFCTVTYSSASVPPHISRLFWWLKKEILENFEHQKEMIFPQIQNFDEIQNLRQPFDSCGGSVVEHNRRRESRGRFCQLVCIGRYKGVIYRLCWIWMGFLTVIQFCLVQ